MVQQHLILANEYRDSVSLMQVANRLRPLPDVEDAAVIMMTPANLALLEDVGLMIEDAAPAPSNLLIVVSAATSEAASSAIDSARAALAEMSTSDSVGGATEREPSRSTAMALARDPDSNLAVISVPGEYASFEAEKAIRLGLNVMVFSDGIDVDEERRIKELADERGLLVMGPDCGTAIISGVPLAFANVAEQGPVGIVGASGTGIQALVCRLDHLGVGVSHAIGTGGHDLHDTVGGISMRRGIRMLGEDQVTEVILLVSKPPSDRVAEAVMEEAARSGKPVVACFLGSELESRYSDVIVEAGLEAAAARAAGLVGSVVQSEDDENPLRVNLAPEQRWIRGLYSGGTLCFEATMRLGEQLVDASTDLFSNTPIAPAQRISDPWTSTRHTLIDLGEDAFTRGRPHPMIDHSIRNDRIMAEADDPETAVIVFDVVLGHGSHSDPATAMAPALQYVKDMAQRGRIVPTVATVVGTRNDPQGISSQMGALEALGVWVTRSHNAALRTASNLVSTVEGAHR